MIRFLTSGESHGQCMTAILEGMPSGFRVDEALLKRELSRRQFGYGRGKRMKIEHDSVRILSGVRRQKTIGSPITLSVPNADQSIDRLPVITQPRPGHADLAGALKYCHGDIRNVLERSSARGTVVRVAIGAFAKMLLKEFGIEVISHVVMIGGIRARGEWPSFDQIRRSAERSAVRCADRQATKRMCEVIDRAAEDGDTLGGVFEVIARGVMPGLGTYVQWDRKLDACIARAVMSIQAIKAVEFGRGFDGAGLRGSEFHDEIFYSEGKGFFRKTNNAGGIEGGVTNGCDIVVRAAMKPLSSLKKPLSSVHLKTKKQALATVERSDTCAVPAAGVVAEAAVSLELANAIVEKFGGDSLIEMRRNVNGYLRQIRAM